MRYLYYPGCSLEKTAREYDMSTRCVMEALGIELIELEGWTCCGASAAESESRLLAQSLPARNLAIAEKMGPGMDIMVPCSACYLNLRKVEEIIRTDAETTSRINQVLAADGLAVTGKVHVRHLLDILSSDMDVSKIRGQVVRPLTGISVAPYYGCQCLRPYQVFDDPEDPKSMEDLIRATGADVFAWKKGAACCGASHMNTHYEVGLALVKGILEAAQGSGTIVTVCPMCQMNLEGFQRTIYRTDHQVREIPVLYLPQLLGYAMGISMNLLGLDLNLSRIGFR